ncbi:hypothetical protein LINPERPRIM_LOCUS1675 [Linum perenne]
MKSNPHIKAPGECMQTSKWYQKRFFMFCLYFLLFRVLHVLGLLFPGFFVFLFCLLGFYMFLVCIL